MSVAEIRQLLIESGMSEEEANNIKGKNKLVFELQKMQSPIHNNEKEQNNLPESIIDTLFEELEEESGSKEKVGVLPRTDPELFKENNMEQTAPGGSLNKQPQIKMGDSGWNDYVLSLLNPSELMDGKPKCAGLRRVAELLLGEITFSAPTQVFPADKDGRATVVYLVEFAWKYGVNEYVDLRSFDFPKKSFGDVADCYRGNTPDMFAVHPSATACTRAEGRCLRKALQLTVCTAEEMSNDKNPTEILKETVNEPVIVSDKDNCSQSQIMFINTKCGQLGIDVYKFTNLEFFAYNDDGHLKLPKYNELREVTGEVAKKMIKLINDYQQNPSSIPSQIKV